MLETRRIRKLKNVNNINKTLTHEIYDTNVREFKLKNSSGDSISLNGVFDNFLEPFFNEINGMGYTNDPTTVQISDIIKVINDNKQLTNIKGTLSHMGCTRAETYTFFNNIKTFINMTKELYIEYTIPFKEEYSLYDFTPKLTCEVKEVAFEYGEIDEKTGLLQVEVEFLRLTPWESSVIQSDFIYGDSNEGTRKYEIVNDDSYVYEEEEETKAPTYGSSTFGTTTVNIFGTALSYPQIILTGVFEKPKITIKYADTNETVKNVSINVTINKGQTLTINNDPTNFYYELDGNNVYQQVNKSNGFDTWIALEPGKYIFEISDETSKDKGDATIKYNWRYL